MRYIKPEFYDRFCCTADRCPDTCCAGWQIMIDEEALERYEKVPGTFGKRLRNSIDWEEGCFCQNNRRCAFLNDRNLCDLFLELGEEGFCDTCRRYPRHVEEFEGLREYSLSLSCPVAAEMILSQEGMPLFITEEDDAEDELEDEFEDFDLMLFTQLEDARNAVFEKLQEHAAAGKSSLQEIMKEALILADRMQICVEEGRYFEIEELIEGYRSQAFPETVNPMERGLISEKMCHAERYKHFQNVKHLERLRDEWTDVLDDMERVLYMDGSAAYQKLCQEFEAYLKEDSTRLDAYENIGRQLFIFFTYTYFCGAVYDGWVYSKMALAVHSVEFIRELLIARWKRKGELSFADYVELSYRYAREIEHSDQNLNELEEIFMEEIEGSEEE